MSHDETMLIICGLLGVLLHCLIKLDGLMTDARVANVEFHWFRHYVYRDFVGILISFLSVFAWFMLFGEVATRFNWLTIFPRVTFFSLGLSGSFALQRWLGKSKKIIQSIVDTKTDISDGKKE